MSREILFRGKRDDTGEWVEGMLAYFFDNPKNSMIMPSCYFGTRDFNGEDDNGNPIIEDETALGGFIPVQHESVGQFTGLLDKNGKKIFEGDFISSTYGSGEPIEVKFGEFNVLVGNYWQNGVGFYYQNSEGEVDIFGKTIDGNTEAYTVIGNLHDNPELIGKEATNG